MENMVKLKEEFDYKSLSKRLEVQLDNLIEENERQQKAFVDEIERITVEAHNQISEAEKRYANALEVSSFFCNVMERDLAIEMSLWCYGFSHHICV